MFIGLPPVPKPFRFTPTVWMCEAFWMKIQLPLLIYKSVYRLTSNALNGNRAASTRSSSAATPTSLWICTATGSDSWRHGWRLAEREVQQEKRRCNRWKTWFKKGRSGQSFIQEPFGKIRRRTNRSTTSYHEEDTRFAGRSAGFRLDVARLVWFKTFIRMFKTCIILTKYHHKGNKL